MGSLPSVKSWRLWSSKSTNEPSQPDCSITMSQLSQNGNLTDTWARKENTRDDLRQTAIKVCRWTRGRERADMSTTIFRQWGVLRTSGERSIFGAENMLIAWTLFFFFFFFGKDGRSLPAVMSAGVLSLTVLLKPQRAAARCHRNSSYTVSRGVICL